MYRLDPVQSSIHCNQAAMTPALGMVCSSKPIKSASMADIESKLFGISDEDTPLKAPLPVPNQAERVIMDRPVEFIAPRVKYHAPQRGAEVNRFLEYPSIPTVEPDSLYTGVNSRELYKF